MEVNQTS